MTLSNLKKERDFLRLLLKNSPLQVKALLYSLTPRQSLVLCGILFNLTKLLLPQKVRTLLRNRKRLVKRLIEPTLSSKKKTGAAAEILPAYLYPLFSGVANNF